MLFVNPKELNMFLLRGYVNYQYSFFFDSGKLAKKCDPLRRVHRGSSASLKKRDYFGNMQGSEARITRADLDLQRQKMKSGSDLVGSDPDGGESLIESSELDSDGNQVRIFVGIYDYIPSVMSPNPDAALEELPFSEGQLLKVGQLVRRFATLQVTAGLILRIFWNYTSNDLFLELRN